MDQLLAQELQRQFQSEMTLTFNRKGPAGPFLPVELLLLAVSGPCCFNTLMVADKCASALVQLHQKFITKRYDPDQVADRLSGHYLVSVKQ